VAPAAAAPPAERVLKAPLTGGYVDTPLSAAILGDQQDARREQLRTELPIRRVVGPADTGSLAIPPRDEYRSHECDV
jgi:hypothetical protein